MTNHKRKTLFVDKEVQGAILKRVYLYWFACVAFMSLPIWLYETLIHPDRMFYEHIGPMIERFLPIYLTMLILLPFVTYDVLRFTNRFCGPLRRVMDHLEQYSKGHAQGPMTFRDNDFWQALADRITKALYGDKSA